MINENTQRTLRAKYNPDGSDLRVLQLKLVEMLVYFDNFCKAHDLKYWLSSGTCLGAVRHGGFIPWDDDVDVEMLRDDYLKFLHFFKEDDNYVLQTKDNDLYYTQPFAKLRSKKIYVDEGNGVLDHNYIHKGLFLDIFVMESSPRMVATICHTLIGSLRHFGFIIKKRNVITDTIFFLLKSIVYGIVSCLRVFDFFCDKNTLRHTLGTGLEKNVRKKDEIFPLGKSTFEKYEIPIPGNYDKYLRRMFGEYMILPNEIHTHQLRISEKK